MKTIQFSCVINKAADVVWDMWSTKKGIEKFFCENTRIDFEVGGRFEILFDMTVEEGLRGSEGMEIIAFEPMSRIGFTWNAPPPSIMAKRGQKKQLSMLSWKNMRIIKLRSLCFIVALAMIRTG